MQSMSGSFRNLAALAAGDDVELGNLSAGGPLSFSETRARASRNSVESSKQARCIVVANHLPVRVSKSEVDSSWEFERDEGALIAHVQDGVEDMEVLYVGCLPVEIDPADQETISLELMAEHNCYPVFLGPELKERFYKGFCKQQLWPLFHYLLPLLPNNIGRFDPELWQAYVKANKVFADKLVEFMSMDDDFIWIHDYHLLVLPSLLRKKFNKMRCGLFLHSPFPSSEIFRTFPKRDELLRSMLNADLIGFHTFDYARHFLSCCSRMLGLEHIASRGSIMVEYYGRNVGVKIMPTGVNPDRFRQGFEWEDTKWRRGELISQFSGQTVLVGVDDMDLFKGIELKLLALERVLDHHSEWRGKLVLVQVSNPPRSSGKDITELNEFVLSLVKRINQKYGKGDYKPVVWLDRPVPLYEKIALYSVADVAVVTATRDGMNLVPYEYIVCREGPEVPGEDRSQKTSSLIISEFVGCSPSMSGAIRVNPWSVDDVADGIYSAIKMPVAEQHLRHDKHWRYVSHHTVKFWIQSFTSDLRKFTKSHSKLRCYGLGLGLDNFRVIALTENFRKLDVSVLMAAYSRSEKRLLLLDYDGTLNAQTKVNPKPTEAVLNLLRALAEDPANTVFIISGRARKELGAWFSTVGKLGIAAEHGFYIRRPGEEEWDAIKEDADSAWRDMVLPIMRVYTDSTDGSHLEEKESALVWNYSNADPDFGHWQAKELLDHLEGVLSNEPVEVVQGNSIVEVKPQGVSKGAVVDRLLIELADRKDSGGATSSPDFVLCIGDDRSDEDMFTAVEHVTVGANGQEGGRPPVPPSANEPSATSADSSAAVSNPAAVPNGRGRSQRQLVPLAHIRIPSAQVFACTVGQKPSRAPFYVNDTTEVAQTLSRLTGLEGPSSAMEAFSPTISMQL